MNVTLMGIDIVLTDRALSNGFEETMVALALIGGLTTVVANAFLMARLYKRQ